MRSAPRAALILAIAVAALLGPLLFPSPPEARATSLPCAAISPAGAIAGAIGPGNPIGDACDAVTDPILGAAADKVLGPLKDAAEAVGKGIFNKVTSWVADGAVWLVGEVAALSEKTTSPDLLSKGFLKQYRLMAMLAAFLAALMLIFAVFEALARADGGMLCRAFLVNTPLAAIASSAAYVVVQLLIAACDGMSLAVSHSAGADSHQFFKGAVAAIAVLAAPAGAAVGGPVGTVAVPLFISFIAVVVIAFAAFFVWIELLMRDAAIYVVALFMPLAIAASIWPRWVGALRRTCELVIVVIFSKFVIVAIIALSASMLAHNEGSVEQVLAAAAMLLLACFAPLVLFKLVPFAEGALAAAYGRQSAASGAVRTVELTNSMLMVQRLSRANWASASAREGGGAGSAKGGGGDSGGGGKVATVPKGGGGGEGAAGAGEGAAAAGGAGAAAAPVVAGVEVTRASRSAAQRLAGTAEAQQVGSGASSGPGEAQASGGGGGSEVVRPAESAAPTPQGEEGPPRQSAGPGAGSREAVKRPVPEPTEARGGGEPASGKQTPRPSGQRATPKPSEGAA